ncbi:MULTISPECIES: hypothetical protein [Pseudonocardia]|uniref:Uncharacterized protein n=2 Tax=Pseudonocardia TaxID=1847 RepID=A0A1Y2N735_PSEAH|nr:MULTISPECIES: hypothetical protein [Pseudonocardia]OSY43286.1 hypothetical protein BG845_00891 [Pseudonocardia autotrophica]TDN71774.1 hypothetical protein C8E95_0808 [Pseudonocardia autotrophica]BBG02462.1 hypothetical protein Pdca_36710 [Pseudonocardia autotrophica]GEC26958.1 hypothetical protein PSA01_39870 [Pseudonocardia saturnea]
MGKPDQPRGPDGKWIRRPGGIVLAIALTLGVIGIGSGGGALGGSTASAPRGSGGGSSSLRAQDRDTTALVARLARAGRVVSRLDVSFDDDCATHSYGQVQEFFRSTPCTGLQRSVFEVRDSARPWSWRSRWSTCPPPTTPERCRP